MKLAGLWSIVILVLSTLAPSVSSSPPLPLTEPYVSEPVTPADTRALPPAPPLAPFVGQPREARAPVSLPGYERTAGAPLTSDPAVQLTPGQVNMPSPSVNFEGISATGVLPPDTDGQVGPNHYVQIVNADLGGAAVRVFDKTGTELHSFGLGYLWPTGDPCRTYAHGDPVVLYDQLADRWLLTQFALPEPPFYECIAVSKTGTPTATPNDWHLYSFLVHDTKMNDYPKLGIWPDGYYMSANQFTDSWAGAGVWVFDRAAMLDGDDATYVYFDVADMNINYGGLLPSNLMGSILPPDGAPNYYMAVDMNWSGSNDVLHIFEFHTDWDTPGNSTFSFVKDLVVDPFDWDLCPNVRERCIHQPDTSVQLEAISDRLMMHLWYRNLGTHESLVVNHTVDANGAGRAGIRWYEIRGGTVDNTLADASIRQQGTYSPDSEHRWMGSIAMDHVGNIALGYSVSSTSVYPSIRYVGRLASEPLGSLLQAEEEIIAGSGSQTHSAARWGDYSAMSVDPVDDCTFWYTQEYIETTGSADWQTRIAAFKFPDCRIQGFDVNASPPELGVSLTGVASYTVEVGPVQPDYSEEVDLSLGGLPANSDASLAPISGTVPFSAALNVTTTASTPLGTYTLTITGTDKATEVHTDTVQLTVYPWPDLSIVKDAVDRVEIGTVLHYSITVDNDGGPATGVVISDTVPGNTQFAWADGGGTLAGNDIVWSDLIVPLGGTLTVSYGVTVTCVSSGTEITNDSYQATANEWPTPTQGAPVVVTAVSEGVTADFLLPDSVLTHQPATFTNLSQNATGFRWAFGDGDFSNEVDPTHTYTLPGPYTVVLTATNTCYEDAVTDQPLMVDNFDVVVSPPADSAAGDPGEVVTYTLQVTNTGTLSDIFQVTITGHSWPTELSTDTLRLDSDEGLAVTVWVTVPQGMSAGAQDYVYVNIQSLSDPRTPPASAQAMLTTTANAVYWVQLGSVPDSLQALAGQMVTYTLHVTNASNALDTIFFTRTNPGWPTKLSTPSKTIAANGHRLLEAYVTVPLTATGGMSDAAMIRATGSGNYAEIKLTTTVLATYGVALSPPAASQTARPGQTLTYTLLVTNTSDVADTITLTRISSGWPTSFSDSSLSIAPGQGDQVEAYVTVPSTATDGLSDTALIRATGSDGYAQSQLTTTVSAVYGVALSPATASQSALVGETVTYTLLVTNTSDVADTITFTRTEPGWPTSLSDPSLTMASGQGGQVEVYVTVPSTATSGLADRALIRATGSGDYAQSELTTTALLSYKIYLPLVIRSS